MTRAVTVRMAGIPHPRLWNKGERHSRAWGDKASRRQQRTRRKQTGNKTEKAKKTEETKDDVGLVTLGCKEQRTMTQKQEQGSRSRPVDAGSRGP